MGIDSRFFGGRKEKRRSGRRKKRKKRAFSLPEEKRRISYFAEFLHEKKKGELFLCFSQRCVLCVKGVQISIFFDHCPPLFVFSAFSFRIVVGK